MSNVTVQEALKVAIDQLSLTKISWCPKRDEAIELCKSALSDMEKCEPFGYFKAEPFGWTDCAETDEGAIALYELPQPIEKCEPVAEAIRERDRLGFAVVGVITKLDEIIDTTQEVEVDDFLHIAIPIDKWHELQDALEEMPKRAELYTSPQPIEKCAPVAYMNDAGFCYAEFKSDLDEYYGKAIPLYTSPISKEWVGLSEAQENELSDLAYEKGYGDIELIRSAEAKLKELNP